MNLFRRRPKLPAGERLYAIGDVHGRFDLLSEIMMQICAREGPFGSAGLTVLMLGDLVDRGPKSAQVIDLVRQSATVLPECVTLKGNHEEVLVAAWRGDLEALAGWLAVGGLDTLASFGVDVARCDLGDLHAMLAATRAAIPEATIDWLDALPLSMTRGDYLFVHAGIRPGLSLEQQEPLDLLWIRDEFLDFRDSHGPVVVHGHTISSDVAFHHNRIGVDIGAYRTGKLAALRLEGTRREVLIARGGEPAMLG